MKMAIREIYELTIGDYYPEEESPVLSVDIMCAVIRYAENKAFTDCPKMMSQQNS
jgi:hypothetical protein